MTKNVEFKLAGNALDYVLSASEHAKIGTARELKYAILHLFAGAELILKSRLIAHDWRLLSQILRRLTRSCFVRAIFVPWASSLLGTG